MRASAFCGSRTSTFWKLQQRVVELVLEHQRPAEQRLAPADRSATSSSALRSACSAPAWSPSEILLHPFSMNVDAPMWSACTAGCSRGEAAARATAALALQRLPALDELQHVVAQRGQLGDLVLDRLEQRADVAPSARRAPRAASGASSRASSAAAAPEARRPTAQPRSRAASAASTRALERDAVGARQHAIDVEHDDELVARPWRCRA